MKKAIFCLGIILCIVATITIMKPATEDPPAVLSTPPYSNTIC
ncbi:hypothetical protein [Candidatus Clostridium radicumherbarum]|uniref:Cyclic lactone autoinducer peptide n=1 Tax=Candidatus Clostridium radicumherbarum TaxID=3381662 RepID=A0ABW8TYQ0_9CLOT